MDYIIFYSVSNDAVDILCIVSGYRNLQDILVE
jgi:hypothetical protein